MDGLSRRLGRKRRAHLGHPWCCHDACSNRMARAALTVVGREDARRGRRGDQHRRSDTALQHGAARNDPFRILLRDGDVLGPHQHHRSDQDVAPEDRLGTRDGGVHRRVRDRPVDRAATHRMDRRRDALSQREPGGVRRHPARSKRRCDVPAGKHDARASNRSKPSRKRDRSDVSIC